MPHAIADLEPARKAATSHRKPKTKPATKGRELQQLHTLLSDVQALYARSQLSQALFKTLASTLKATRVPITRILSLGLGSLSAKEKGQTRRFKQLVLLLAIRDSLERVAGKPIEIYAQDPVFTKADDSFLASLGIEILHTPAGSSLGEAASLISPSTLIYSPFLTLEAYEQLLLHFDSREDVRFLIGDDFNALREKWPKYSEEKAQVEKVMKNAVARYRRRAVAGDGFWMEEDGTFPMAMYAIESRSRVQERARI